MSFHMRLTPHGSQVSGKDVSPADLVETQQLNDKLKLINEQEGLQVLIDELNGLNLQEFDFFSQLGQDLSNSGGNKILAPRVGAQNQAAILAQRVDQYLGGL